MKLERSLSIRRLDEQELSPISGAKMSSLKTIVFALTGLALASPLLAQHRQAPPGMFKELDDQNFGKAIVIHSKQLFIDDYVIEELKGAEKVLNQPVKHLRNP